MGVSCFLTCVHGNKSRNTPQLSKHFEDFQGSLEFNSNLQVK